MHTVHTKHIHMKKKKIYVANVHQYRCERCLGLHMDMFVNTSHIRVFPHQQQDNLACLDRGPSAMGLYKMPYTNKSREEKTSSWQETVSCEVSPMDICFSNCCGFQGCISFVTHLISFPRLPHSCWRSNRLGVFPAFNLNTLVVHYNLKSKK